MEWLSKALEKNKTINVIMFFVTLLGTIITVILGWKQFYSDYLSFEISMPIWVIFLIMIMLLVSVVAFSARKSKSKMLSTQVISGQSYGIQRVEAGGKRFVRCHFQGSQVILSVIKGVGFEHCRFDGVHFTWGEDESVMIFSLAKMYSDPAFRPMVEEMFNHIRTDSLPEAPPSNNLSS